MLQCFLLRFQQDLYSIYKFKTIKLNSSIKKEQNLVFKGWQLWTCDVYCLQVIYVLCGHRWQAIVFNFSNCLFRYQDFNVIVLDGLQTVWSTLDGLQTVWSTFYCLCEHVSPLKMTNVCVHNILNVYQVGFKRAKV